MSPRCGADDSAEGALMGPNVNFEGVELKHSGVPPIIALVGVATSICAKGPPPGSEACMIHRTRWYSMGRVSCGARLCSNDDQSVGRASVMRGRDGGRVGGLRWCSERRCSGCGVAVERGWAVVVEDDVIMIMKCVPPFIEYNGA
jgi:hypothetical protein